MIEGTRVPYVDSPNLRSGQDHSCISYVFFFLIKNISLEVMNLLIIFLIKNSDLWLGII